VRRWAYILNKRSGRVGKAQVIDVSREKMNVLTHKWDVLSMTMNDPEGEHGDWNWAGKQKAYSGDKGNKIFAIKYGGHLQGLMMIGTDGFITRSGPARGESLAYIHYIQTAPWNLKQIENRIRYGWIGIALIRIAIEVSSNAGYNGRIGLHSLPQAERFYLKFQITDHGVDKQCSERLRYFEMTSSQAEEFLWRYPYEREADGKAVERMV
jgi:hypothetical protein